MNHNPSSEVNFNRISAASIHINNTRSEHRSDENGQNVESPIQDLSLVCDETLAAENQGVVEAASERISLRAEREDMEEGLTRQDVRA